MKTKKAQRAAKLVSDWNSTWPIGTHVTRYRLVDPVDTKTRSAAWLFRPDLAVIMVDGIAGGVMLESIIPK